MTHNDVSANTSAGGALHETKLLQPQGRLDVYQVVCMFFQRCCHSVLCDSWGNAVLQPRYAKQAMTRGLAPVIRASGAPVFKSCLPWIVVRPTYMC